MHSGVAVAAVLGWRRLLVKVRAGGRPRAGESCPGTRALPGLWPYCLPFCWGAVPICLTCHVTRAASCLKGREGTARLYGMPGNAFTECGSGLAAN